MKAESLLTEVLQLRSLEGRRSTLSQIHMKLKLPKEWSQLTLMSSQWVDQQLDSQR